MLKIEVGTIAAVLVGDRWHEVRNQTFDVVSYEFVRAGQPLVGGGRNNPPAGFMFSELVSGSETVITGPLTAISAIRLRPEETP